MKRILLGTFLLHAWCLDTILHATPAASTPQFANEWNEIPLAGETSCARGTPFSFFVSPGKTNKIVIDFLGGGACWNTETCDTKTKTFIESIEEFKTGYSDKLFGIYARRHEENPLKDWYHIIVPYCTGDLHWGANDKTYTKKNGTTFEVKHRGAINAKAVLKWVEENFKAPEKILVTGASGGAYGSIYWLSYIRKAYPNASVLQLGDSGISPITEEFSKIAFEGWNIEKEGPTWVPGLNPKKINWSTLQISYLYEKLIAYHPDVHFAHFTSAFDGKQRMFYWLMGGDPTVWPSTISNTLHSLASKSDQFHYFVSPGLEHCILPTNEFYTITSNDGKKFKPWLEDYISGKPVMNIDCVNCEEEERLFWAEMVKSEESNVYGHELKIEL